MTMRLPSYLSRFSFQCFLNWVSNLNKEWLFSPFIQNISGFPKPAGKLQPKLVEISLILTHLLSLSILNEVCKEFVRKTFTSRKSLKMCMLQKRTLPLSPSEILDISGCSVWAVSWECLDTCVSRLTTGSPK